jgi:hypothetical protein
MANCLTAGYSIDCTQGGCSGGLQNIFIAQVDDIDTITYGANGEITGITMQATKVFYEFDFQDGTAQYTESLTVTNCNIAVEQSLTWVVPCRNDTLRQRIEELANCCCGQVVIFTEMTGTQWAFGDLERRRARLGTNEADSGTALADQNQETITMTASTTKKAVEFTGVVPT